ncbi:hypothetical protein ADU90_14675 [Clostridium botulinum]|uniref:hypothetical protein n=1 Tax=Clostridium botulinum TaxID=1491 RepID=UPI0006A4DB30|nr:hypothetical protein [Clostridium botulinum]KOC50921.1 hypothetical protein ADU89_14260 [Clostridium botulinum]KOC52308.1 hypothetical protein ADU90_14675 [Clostridium botulinum]
MLMSNLLINGMDNKIIEIFNRLKSYTAIDGTFGFPVMKCGILMTVGLISFETIGLLLKNNDNIGETLNAYKVPEIATVGIILAMIKILL